MAHVIRSGGTDYDEFSAGLVAQAVGAVVGDGPATKARIARGAAGDSYSQLLTVYSRSLSGDPVACASWSAIEAHSPGLARLVRKMARPGKGKAAPAAGADEDYLSYLARAGAPKPVVKAARAGLTKSRGTPPSRVRPDPALAHYAAGNRHAARLLMESQP